MTKVVVVGAGIVGAAVAYELALAGAAVTLLDKALPASGVTGDSFAWIGGPAGSDVPDGSWPLRCRALEAYRRLGRTLPGVRVRWTGSLTWNDDWNANWNDNGNDDRNEPNPVEHHRLGPDEHLLDAAQVGRLGPNLAAPPARCSRTATGRSTRSR